MSGKLNYNVKICIGLNDLFFGVGVARLLNLVEKTFSLNQACKEMDMSYGKALRIIREAEYQLGFKLIERKIGGTNGGGSELTAEGKDFLNCFAKFQFQLLKVSDELFENCFKKYI